MRQDGAALTTPLIFHAAGICDTSSTTPGIEVVAYYGLKIVA
jgi:hypothetical protein